MTALVTGDWHLSSNPRDEYRHKFIANELPAMIRRLRPSTLIVLGDLTDQKDCHNAELVGDIASYIHRLSKLCRVIILRGNHDCINPDAPFFGFLSYFDNVDFIYDSKVENIIGLGLCVFLAHTRNHKKSWARFDFAPYKRDPNAGFIFCHNTFEGALTVAKGHPLQGIPTSALPTRAHVISGDVHMPQTIDQVTYVGAPYTVTFGDTYKPRLYMIGCTPKGAIQTQSIPCEGPCKRTIDVTDIKKVPNPGIAPGDMLKIRVHLKAEDYARWAEIKDAVHDWGTKLGAVVCQVQPIKTAGSTKLQTSRVNTKTDAQLLDSFGARKQITSDLMKTGHWLLTKV